MSGNTWWWPTEAETCSEEEKENIHVRLMTCIVTVIVTLYVRYSDQSDLLISWFVEYLTGRFTKNWPSIWLGSTTEKNKTWPTFETGTGHLQNENPYELMLGQPKLTSSYTQCITAGLNRAKACSTTAWSRRAERSTFNTTTVQYYAIQGHCRTYFTLLLASWRLHVYFHCVMTTPWAIVNPHDAEKLAWPFLLQIKNNEALTVKVDQVVFYALSPL
jgi:hypothetical protein